MATVTVVDPVALNSTANGTSYVSNSFTPAAGDLVVVFVYAATTSSTATLSSSDGLTFSDIDQNTGTGISLYSFVSNEFANNVSQTVTFDCTGENADAVVIEVFLISGASNNGADAVRQFARVVSGSGGATVRTTFASAALSGSVILTCVGSVDDTPGLTDPSGFTRGHETITSSPADSATSAYTASGFTGTQVTFGNTLGSSWKMTSVEILPVTPVSVTADAASFAATGAAVSLERGRKVVAAAASFAITAAAVSTEIGREVAVQPASFAFAGQSVSLEYGREVAALAASFTVTGQDVSLERGRLVAIAAGSFAYSAQPVSLEYGREVAVSAAAFAFSGSDATFVYEPIAGYLIFAETTTFAVSGSAVALEIGREIAVDGATFGYSGEAADVLRGFELAVQGDSFGFTASQVTLQLGTAPTDPATRIDPRKPGSRFSDRRFNEGGFRPLRK